jgi:hypothetical protein
MLDILPFLLSALIVEGGCVSEVLFLFSLLPPLGVHWFWGRPECGRVANIAKAKHGPSYSVERLNQPEKAVAGGRGQVEEQAGRGIRSWL